MRLYSYKKDKFKILGLTIFKQKIKEDGVILYIFGVPCCKVHSSTIQIQSDFKSNKLFDTRSFDRRIAECVNITASLTYKKDEKSIGYLATEIYDMGGHTKCIRDLIVSLSGIYNQYLFLTKITTSQQHAPQARDIIQKHASIQGIDAYALSFNKDLKQLCNQILSSHIKVLLVYIHPNDILGTAVLAYLKNTTDIRIIYINHASHFPSLGMSFANVVLEGMPSTEKITHEQRGILNTDIIGLQSLRKNDTIYYDQKELNKLKNQMGVKDKAFITMSGGSAYKFFEDSNTSHYFEMIKRILKKEKSVYHIVITQLNSTQSTVVDRIFQDAPKEKKRLIFIPYQSNFDKYFQCADVFIDSFPVSSALTQIDLMRNKVASVVKINKENPEFSFHEYQMPDYPYMFENVSDMEDMISELLHDEQKRHNIIEQNYQYWLKTYESDIVRDKYIKVIEGEKI